MYIGSWAIDNTVVFTVTTHDPATGALIDADSAPSYRVYENETGTAILSGSMALLDDTNTTGHYSEQITLSAANGFEKGKSYNIYITAVVGGVTGGATRMLQVEAEVDANRLNWAGVDNPSTTVGLSGTTVKTATDVETDTADIQTRLPAALVSGRIDASVGAMAANTVTAAALHTDAAAEIADAVWDEDATAHQTQGTFGQAIGDPAADTNTIYKAVVTDAAGANIAADIADVETKVDDLETRLGVPSDLGSGATVAANLADIDGAAGGGLDAAGVRAAVGLASANLDTQLGAIDDFLDTEIAAIKAKTDNLPSDPADASDIAAAFTNLNTKVDTIDDFLDTEIAAIKAKTDNLPSDPADASDIAAAFATVNSTLATIDGRIDTEVGAIKAKTDNLPADPADASDIAASFATVNTAIADLPTNAELATALAAADDAVLAAIDAVPTNAELTTALTALQDALEATIAALNNLSAAEVNAEVVDALTVDVIADSTPALGSRPTIAEALLMLTRLETEKEVSGTAVTVNKEDHATQAMELELDDADNPTSVTRSA